MAQDSYSTIRREVEAAFASDREVDVPSVRHVLEVSPMLGPFTVQELDRHLKLDTVHTDGVGLKPLRSPVKQIVELLCSLACTSSSTLSALISLLVQSGRLRRYVQIIHWQLLLVLAPKVLHSPRHNTTECVRQMVSSSVSGVQELLLQSSTDNNSRNSEKNYAEGFVRVQLQDLQEAAGAILAAVDRLQLGDHVVLLLRSLLSKRSKENATKGDALVSLQ
eukprot:3192480-Rhodomonas_salina.1